MWTTCCMARGIRTTPAPRPLWRARRSFANGPAILGYVDLDGAHRGMWPPICSCFPFVTLPPQIALVRWAPVVLRLERVLSETIASMPFVTVTPDASPPPPDRRHEFVRASEVLAQLLRFLCVILEHHCQSEHLPKNLPEVV